MPMYPDTAFRFENVQIHVLHGEEFFVPGSITLVTVCIEHPGLDVSPQFTAVAELEIIRKHVPVMQKTKTAVRGLANPNFQEVVPAAENHVQLVVVVRPVPRIPPGSGLVGPGPLDMTGTETARSTHL